MYSYITQCFGWISKAPNSALICFDESFHDIQEPSYFFLIQDSLICLQIGKYFLCSIQK